MADDPFFASSLGRWAMATRSGNAPRWQRALARGVATALAVARDVAEGPMTLHASSLVYTTLLSIVPLMALAFSILKGFGVHNQVAPLLKELLAPLGKDAGQITENVVTFVDNMHVGVLGASGLAILLYTSISVGRQVEHAFNQIWHVTVSPTLGRSITKYLSIIVAGPILLFSAFGTTASLMSSAFTQDLSEIKPMGQLIAFASTIFPYVVVLAGFSIFYLIVPNTRVRFVAALSGGIAASIAWTLAGWAFGIFVASSTSYTAIYSAFASVILLLIWLNVNWLVLLIGCAVAFYVQHPQSLVDDSDRSFDDPWAREHAALRVIRAVGRRHYQGEPADSETLHRETGLPQATVEVTLSRLEQAGILLRSADAPPVWAPRRPFDTTPLKDVWAAIHGRDQHVHEGMSGDAVVTSFHDRIARGVSEALGTATLKDLALAPPPPGRNDTGAATERRGGPPDAAT